MVALIASRRIVRATAISAWGRKGTKGMSCRGDRREEKNRFYDKVDEVLDFGRYRRSLMELKWTMWELQRLVSAEQGEE
jgi:hypothetical protein